MNIPPSFSAHENFASDKIRLLMQLRRMGITDTALLAALEQTPREDFIEGHLLDQAYADTALPIGQGQTISQPSVVAWMSWALSVEPRHRVLEIGTGSGYQAAVLARLCRRVYTIERHRELMMAARVRFATLGLENITSMQGDGSRGWPEAAPYDRIIVTAGAPNVPASLLAQLSEEGGVLVIPVGPSHGEQMLLRIEKRGEELQTQHLMPVRFVPLVGAFGTAPPTEDAFD
jgi:protein-L-isoaspartate(D-aspartate) O-methyltransferase